MGEKFKLAANLEVCTNHLRSRLRPGPRSVQAEDGLHHAARGVLTVSSVCTRSGRETTTTALRAILLPPVHRPTTLPRRGRSTALAGFARSATAAPARLRRAYAIPRAPRLAWPVLRPPYGRARATPAATWSVMSTGLDAATRFPSSGASRRRYHPRALVMGNANGHRPR